MSHTILITGAGKTYLHQPITVSGIQLVSITLEHTVYNLTEATKFVTVQNKEISISPGYYNYEELKSILEGHLVIDDKTLKVTYTGTLTGGLKKRIKNDRLYLNPLSLRVHVSGIDTSKNMINGKPSDLLTTIPLGNTKFGTVTTHEPSGNHKVMYGGRINELNVAILDDEGNAYDGKFEATFKLSV